MSTIEERLAKLEKEVAELKAEIQRQSSKENWLKKIAGSFKEDPEYDEIIRLGRELRQAERPENDE